MVNEIEYLKRLNMVEFLSLHYRMQFRQQGDAYACLSPFTNESNPSFHVRRAEDGHWLVKDFSSGHGGSIIDFVLLKEQLNSVSDAAAHLRKLFEQAPPPRESEAPSPSGAVAPSGQYDIDQLYRQ